jgi:hypothetical protein
MKTLAATVFGLSLVTGTVAHAGYRFDIDQTKSLCLSKIHPNSAEALQEIANSAIATLISACEEHPGAEGAISTLKSVEVQNKGACGFGLYRYEYRVTADCYIP